MSPSETPALRAGGRLLQLGRTGRSRVRVAVIQHPRVFDGAAMLGVAMVVLAVAHNLLRAGFPPGVDTPTFLHMSWFTRETLRGDGGLVDPYWYGGFSLYTTYPPLSYGLVGLLAAVPGVGLVLTYKVVLLAAHAAIGAATYFLALQLANTRGWAALAALLAVLAYPALVAVGLWGWFSSVVALPFALLAFGLLERAHTGGRRRLSVAGGVALGLSFLAHHRSEEHTSELQSRQ